MSLVYSSLKYLAIGICLGIGILAVDQLYFKYGNPHQITLMEGILEELYESQEDIFDFAGFNQFPSFSFHVLGKNLTLEEKCTVYLRERPNFRCQDEPHQTSGSLSVAENLEERFENIRRIAVDGTFIDSKHGTLHVVTWFTDVDKLSEVMDELRTEPRQDTQGIELPMPEIPPRFSAIVCSVETCLTISSLSRTKVEGLLAQILAP